jgi:ABC-2 type transport system permease protein
MTSPSNALPDSSAETQAVTSVTLIGTRPFYWSIRRELWEYRSIYLAPLAVAGLFFLGVLIVSVNLPAHMRTLALLGAEEQHEALLRHYDFAAGVVMLVAFLISVYYALDALYGERRDRSILFWKSLPVSDLTTVLSKATVALIIVPLFAFAVTVVLQFLMLVWSSVILAASGLSVSMLWFHVSPFQNWVMLLYHLVTVHMLWYAPIYSYLLLISAWARRAPFLWVVLPPLAIAALEKIIFNSAHFAKFIAYRFGGPEKFSFPSKLNMDAMMSQNPGKFFSSPGLWLGLLAAGAFLVLAARLRRYRDPI